MTFLTIFLCFLFHPSKTIPKTYICLIRNGRYPMHESGALNQNSHSYCFFYLELYTYIMNGEIYFSFVGEYEHREAEILEHHVVSKWVPLDILTTCMFSPLVHTWKTDHGTVLVYTFCSYKTGIFPSGISPKIFWIFGCISVGKTPSPFLP